MIHPLRLRHQIIWWILPILGLAILLLAIFSRDEYASSPVPAGSPPTAGAQP